MSENNLITRLSDARIKRYKSLHFLGFIIRDMLDNEKGIVLPAFEFDKDYKPYVTIDDVKHSLDITHTKDHRTIWIKIDCATLREFRETAQLMYDYSIRTARRQYKIDCRKYKALESEVAQHMR